MLYLAVFNIVSQFCLEKKILQNTSENNATCFDIHSIYYRGYIFEI